MQGLFPKLPPLQKTMVWGITGKNDKGKASKQKENGGN